MMKVGILGASGYTGCELLRLLRGHPILSPTVVVGRSDVGKRVSDAFPSLGAAGELVVSAFSEAHEALVACDMVFSALPHGELAALVAAEPKLFSRIPRIVDLASDFRLRDPAGYRQWYGTHHPCPEELSHWRYSIPEWHREQVRGATRVANAGCFATAYLLGVAPLVRNGLVTGALSGVGISGTSGAGKSLSARLHFSNLCEDVVTYRVAGHQHGGEIEELVGALTDGRYRGPVALTTVLAPMSRGLQVIVTAEGSADCSEPKVRDAMQDAYAGEPFITICQTPPDTKYVRGAHRAEICATYDQRTGLVSVITVIDNLVKGAAGSAIQNANLMLGIDEEVGLPREGVYP